MVSVKMPKTIRSWKKVYTYINIVYILGISTTINLFNFFFSFSSSWPRRYSHLKVQKREIVQDKKDQRLSWKLLWRKEALTVLVKIRETNPKRTSVTQTSRSNKVVFLTRWRTVRIILIHLKSKNLKWNVLFLPSRTNAISQVYPGRQPDQRNKFWYLFFSDSWYVAMTTRSSLWKTK